MSIPPHTFVARLMVAGIMAGLCVTAQRLSLSAQGTNQPGPVEAVARPATVDNPVPPRLGVQPPPEGAATLLRRSSLAGYSGAILLKVTLDESGRVADARPIGLAVSGANPSTHRVVQEDPLPSAEQSFAPDDGMTRAALDLTTFARQSVRQQQYQPPANGPLSFYVVVVSMASGRLTTATTIEPPDLRELFPPSAVTSNEPPAFPTTGPAAPVAMTWSRWDPATGLPGSGTVAANAGQATPPAQPATPATGPSRGGAAGQPRGGAAGPGAAAIAAGTSSPSAPAPPRTAGPQSAASTATAPIRVGGNVMAPRKVKDVKPIYPADAQAEGVQGIVIIETTIDANGKVTGARVLRSIPRLDEAAIDAVKQWEFEPTHLNGAPVPIIMSVTVNFTLNR